MLRAVRTFSRRLALFAATVIFLAIAGLAVYIFLDGDPEPIAEAFATSGADFEDWKRGGSSALESAWGRLLAVLTPAETTPDLPFEPEPNLPPHSPSSTPPIQVLFGPADPAAVDGIDDHLIALIRSARQSVVAAFYDFEYAPAAEALIERHRAGVSVQLVADSDYRDRLAVMTCIDAGIPVLFDDRSGLMHNKFCVVDGDIVWTGSANITENGLFKNNNNVVILRSSEVAHHFFTEFSDMFGQGNFGPQSTRSVQREPIQVGGVPVEIYFAPQDNVESRIRYKLGQADESIDFMAFSFTSKPIADAMVDRMKWGVRVRGLFEARNAGSQYSQDDFLESRGADVRLDTNPHAMHHKVIVIDNDTVITGSYNFSRSAEVRNDENVLILHARDIAGLYTEEFERLIAAQ